MKRSLLILMCFSFFALTACGDGDGDGKNLCADVTCDQGICDLGSGECINAADCGTSDDACLAGYECNANVCTATVSCDIDNPCDRGTCVDNSVCLNPTTCNTNSNCLGGFFCTDENVCSDDLCSSTVCDNGGICELGTGACVNADTCRRETQAQDCLSGFGCVEGACVNEADYCDELDCKRGVCSFEGQGCIDAPNCDGDDVQCLSGNYCDADNTCQTNRCDVLGTECARGVCDPGQGVCVDAVQCAASTDCIDAKVCLDGTCTPTAEACGATGCTGNQECAFIEATLMAACQENANGCLAGLDCTGDRICVDGACAAPGMCSDDALEPNNVTGQETDIVNVLKELSLCSGDSDLFIFDTTTDEDPFGMLNVVVDIDAADVGLGEVKLELINPLGNVVQSGSSIVNGIQTGHIDLRHPIDVVTQGKYILRVTGDAISTAGVRYSLRSDVVDSNILTACGMATAIDPAIPTSGNTAMGSSVELKSCGDNTGLAKESIFTLTIDVPSYVTLRALPAMDVDVTLSLRSICAQDDTNLVCANSAGLSDPEQIQAALSPGVYYVIVESDQAGEGAFSIVTTLEPVICEPADNTCADASNANVCNAQGTAFENEVCENGCDMAANACIPDVGDVCETAIPVTDTYSGTIDWTSFKADYEPNVACVPLDGTNTDTDGEDVVFAVTIPDGSALVASLERPIGDSYSAMYFVTDCLDVSASCLVGVNEGQYIPEKLFYQNTSGADIAGFLIVDRGTASPNNNLTPIEISVSPVVCTPAETRCVLNRESQTCNAAGTAYDTSTTCNFGCDVATGACVTALNDVCGGAIVLTPGVPENGDIAILAKTYNAVGCNSRNNGPDASYVLQNVPVGSLIEVEMVTDFDAVLWAARECNADVISSCTNYSDGVGAPETLSFIASETGDYYFIADTYSTFLSSGTFTITATVTPPQCTVGVPLGCLDGSTLQYCSDTGQIIDLTCDSGCANDKCNAPAGDICFDAKRLTPTLSNQNVNGTLDIGTDSSAPSGPAGSCNFTGNPLVENDSYFIIDIPAQHSLEISFDTYWAELYIIDATCDVNSCKDRIDYFGGDLEYYSALGETIIIVVDAFTSGTASDNEWDFDYQLIAYPGRICTVGEIQCTGNIAELCDETQMAYTAYACPNGCSDGLCIDDPAVSQTCATAPDVTGGFIGTIDEDDHTNDVDGRPCGARSAGGDAHFQVSLQAGEILYAFASGGTQYTQLYFYTDCLDPVASCQAGSPYSRASELFYQATVAETVFIGVDNESTFADADDVAIILIEVLQPECANGQPVVCNADGDALEFCNQGLLEEVACGGNGVCTGDKCENPRGNICHDAIPLAGVTPSIVSVSSSFSGANSAFNARGAAGACYFAHVSTTTIPDRIFEIPLNEGDLLKIVHDGSGDSYVVFASDCTDTTSCLASNTVAVSDVTIDFLAPTTQTFFVIFRSEGSSSSSFSFDYEVIPAPAQVPAYVCNPNSYFCLDANTAALCDDDGQVNAQSQFACPSGCVDGELCVDDVAVNDTCGTAPDVTNGFVGFIDSQNHSNDVSSDPCGSYSAGGDAHFQVALLANEILRVSVAGGIWYPSAYIYTDCLDPSTSCQSGSQRSVTSSAIEYQSAVDQIVFIGIDNESSTSPDGDDIPLVIIEIIRPECVPGAVAHVCNVDASGFEYCDETGFFQTYDCGGAGMCDAATNRCTNPVGDICFDPYEATPAAVATPNILNGTMSGNDDYSLIAGNICTGSQTPGNDQVYVVDLLMGQTLTAALVSTDAAPEDLAMYLTKDCAAVPNSCLVGADTQPAGTTAETLTYTAGADETVFIIVDSFFANAAGTFDLTVEVTNP